MQMAMDAGPSPDRSADFGGRMKRLREERGVALRAIAEATKISVSSLEALERNDVSRLPGGIFSRGLVRAYAEQVGADPEKTVREFIARFPDESATIGTKVSAHAIDTDPPSQFARRLVITLAILVPIAALIVWAVLSRR
jgi:cytoskeleton protein RodZ